MKEKVIYLYPNFSAFIKKDIDFLNKKYDVITPDHNWSNKKETPLNFLKQLFFLLINMPSAKATLVMFGGYWSFLPSLIGKLLNKPVYVILGGTDCVSFPSLNYGSLRKPVLRQFVKWSYQLCTKLIPVDESLVFSKYTYYHQAEHSHQGYKYFFPQINTEYQVIHNGFDSTFFNNTDIQKKPKSFITIASVDNVTRFKLKGFDIVLQLAEIYKDCSFTIVGITEDMRARLNPIPVNVKIYPFLPQDEFKQFLFDSQFYLQLSISEGFPNALGEAMLCECVPVGSAVGAIPKIIDGAGFIMLHSDINYIVSEFEKILTLHQNELDLLASKARTRIIENFSIAKREDGFFKLLENKSTSSSNLEK